MAVTEKAPTTTALHKAKVDADRRRAETGRDLRDASDRLGRARAIADPNAGGKLSNQPPPDPVLFWETRKSLPGLEAREAECMAAWIVADRAATAAHEAWVEAMRAEAHRDQRRLAATAIRHAKALQEVMDAIILRELQVAEATSRAFQFPELANRDMTSESITSLSRWLALVHEMGIHES